MYNPHAKGSGQSGLIESSTQALGDIALEAIAALGGL